MEASTTIKKMLSGNKIIVPSYQRAYSWDTEILKEEKPQQVNVFLSDLEEYNNSRTKAPYYFGHFLFEEFGNNKYGVIDGQQRLTTIVIFLSALFKRLKEIRGLSESEQEVYEDVIKRNSTYRFETVDYDRQLFFDYVINQTKKDKNSLETLSAKRIVAAFDYFAVHFKNQEDSYLINMLQIVQNATCTTHQVMDESEAIQMFIFQNNRGKKPSNLEIIKAQFLFNVHLYGGQNKDSLIEEIKNRFEKIYKSISTIEYSINEDDILVYTLRVHFNSLWETNSIERINKMLSDGSPIKFIKEFTQSLQDSFDHLSTFFSKDERSQFEVHSLIMLGGIGVSIPFIIKAYKLDLPKDKLNQLCTSFESIVIRHRIIGTRADITSRINDVYQEFSVGNSDIQPIIDRIDWIKRGGDGWWWAYWNNDAFQASLNGAIPPTTARFMLWKYEHYLESQGKGGYVPRRLDTIENPELEHIAPRTPTNGKPIAAGYCEYDEEFRKLYIDCLGNYLLVSKSHNSSIGNISFSKKLETYKYLAQQREIQEISQNNLLWDKQKIDKRHDKLVDFVLKKW